MQKEIRNKIFIVGVFFIVFTAIGVFTFLLTKDHYDKIILLVSLLFIFIGLCALFYMIKMIEETRKIKEDFHNLSESKGDAKTLEIANKLQNRLAGLNYVVQTNDNGFRVLEDLDETHIERINYGKSIYLPGYNFIKTLSNNTYKEISIDMKYKNVDGQIIQKPILIGGKSFRFKASMQIERDENGNIITTSAGLKNINLLQEVIFEAKKEDGWKTSFDAESKFALIMAIIGGGGAIITAIALLIDAIL